MNDYKNLEKAFYNAMHQIEEEKERKLYDFLEKLKKEQRVKKQKEFDRKVNKFMWIYFLLPLIRFMLGIQILWINFLIYLFISSLFILIFTLFITLFGVIDMIDMFFYGGIQDVIVPGIIVSFGIGVIYIYYYFYFKLKWRGWIYISNMFLKDSFQASYIMMTQGFVSGVLFYFKVMYFYFKEYLKYIYNGFKDIYYFLISRYK
ncbi:hypothetical protein MK079_02105 [Candidatus Gracilibacteria bacterium]|nr:hypothetical protein [Candidatus Gracilibacteria bacterium]